METLREGKTSLLMTPPERENVGVAGEIVHSEAVIADVRPEGHTSRNVVVASDGLDVSDRFSKAYNHPDILCKHVPYDALKRCFDVILAVTILVLASPIILIAAILVPLTSRGPIIFRQVRVGRGGRYFTCYKFRSMCVDAEEQKRALQHLNEMDGPVFKIKRDPRITRVGAFIRKYSIDELPQLVNVIRGDMSMVGPRPPVPSEVEKYGPHELKRLAVRPGLTCLWQISGRSNISFERWVELDLEYIDHMSFIKDVGIVARTIPAVISGAGAH